MLILTFFVLICTPLFGNGQTARDIANNPNIDALLFSQRNLIVVTDGASYTADPPVGQDAWLSSMQLWKCCSSRTYLLCKVRLLGRALWSATRKVISTSSQILPPTSASLTFTSLNKCFWKDSLANTTTPCRFPTLDFPPIALRITSLVDLFWYCTQTQNFATPCRWPVITFFF